MQSITWSENPRSFAVMFSSTSLTFFCCAIGSSWSACGASPLNAWPPCEPRQMFCVWAPEQARLIFSFTEIGALLIGATSARWQPFAYELPYTRVAS